MHEPAIQGGHRPSLAIVIQRYGKEIGGGSELHCQLLAERLAKYYRIEIVTTTAQDHRTWKNVYPVGVESVNGIAVRRFAVDGQRDLERFESTAAQIFWKSHDKSLELNLLRYQGPYCPGLIEYIKKNRTAYDAWFFFTYLYYPTALGLPVIGRHAVFQPTAHDEQLLYLEHFDTVFRATPHIVFNSDEERLLVQRRFTLDSDVGRVIGVGIDNPCAEEDEAGWTRLREQLGSAKVITFVGRVEGGKGCDELVEFFLRFAAHRPAAEVKLLLLGRKVMKLPDHPAIIAPGYVSDYVKAKALAHSCVSVAPSSRESLCMAAQEAWYHGCPVLANGRSEVLVGHCVRSNGGLWYENFEEFDRALTRLVDDSELARHLGSQGRAYVKRTYTWDRIENLYREVIDAVMVPAARESKDVVGLR